MLLRSVLAAMICFVLTSCANAASARLNLPSFAGLQHKATETVDITIGRFPLRIVGRLMDDDDEDSADLKKVILGLQAIVIRSYSFATDNAYSKADIDSVRAQLSGPAWSQLATVRDKKENEDVDVYVAYDHDKVAGIAIVASGPREFTIVNIVGEVDLEHVASLEKKFGLRETHPNRVSAIAL